MAEAAKGSSASSPTVGGGGAGAVVGATARGGFPAPSGAAVAAAAPHAHAHGTSFQALLASMGNNRCASPNGGLLHHHHQGHGFYNNHPPAGGGGPIHAPPPMPVAMAPPYAAAASVTTMQPPPCALSGYQYWQATGSQNGVSAQQVPGGFADWTVYNHSAFMSVTCGSSSSTNNGYHHQSLRPCSTTAWPNFITRNPCYSTYPPAIHDHQSPSYHSNNHAEDSGFASSFRVDPQLGHVPCFPPMSPASNNHSPVQFFNEAPFTTKSQSEAMHTQKEKNSEDPPDMESENSEELNHNPVHENLNLNQGPEDLTARFNCKEYHIVLRKDLTNSDVGNIGRIVLPKRDAEANLPALLERDGLILQMDDFNLVATWNFKYRFWPNNKSRMYILESTGEFVKSHGLEAGDTLIIYKNPESGKFLVRGEKASQQSAPLLCVECKEEGSNSEECGFALSLHTKRS